MIKDFNFIQKGHIYYAKLPNKNSSIQSGKRPVLILGVYGNIVNIIPLTTKMKRMDLLSHIKVKSIDIKGNIKDSNCLLEQIQTIPKNDILNLYGTISKEDKKRINNRLKQVISI